MYQIFNTKELALEAAQAQIDSSYSNAPSFYFAIERFDGTWTIDPNKPLLRSRIGLRISEVIEVRANGELVIG